MLQSTKFKFSASQEVWYKPIGKNHRLGILYKFPEIKPASVDMIDECLNVLNI